MTSQPVLDAGTYPHLLQLVVDLAPYASLISLRAACRALRTRADMHLNAGRLIVTTAEPALAPRKGEQPRVGVSSEHGRLPAFAEWAVGPPAPPRVDGKRTDVLPENSTASRAGTSAGYPPLCQATRASFRSSEAGTNPPHPVSFPPTPQDQCNPFHCVADLRYTTAIDLVGPVASEYTRRLVESRPFRWGPRYVRTFGLNRMDVYTQAAPPPDMEGRVKREWHTNMGGLALVKFGTLPQLATGKPNAARIDPKTEWDEVVHIDYHPNDNYTANRPPGECRFEGAQSLTYIFHLAEKASMMAAPEDELDFTSLNMYEAPDLLDWLCARLAAQAQNGAKVTVVDVEVLAGSAWLEGFHEDDVPRQFRRKCAQLARRGTIRPNLVDGLFEFKTMDEFRAGLPAHRDAAVEITREGHM